MRKPVKPAQNITGFLTVRDTQISSELIPEAPEEGQYATIIDLPDDVTSKISLQLAIGEGRDTTSSYDFTLSHEKFEENQQTRRGKSFTKILLISTAAALSIIGKLWLFGVI